MNYNKFIKRRRKIMKYCQHCGARIDDETEYCPTCGCIVQEESRGGSLVAGFCLSFFLGIIGLIIGLLWDDGKTKEGAKAGFLASLLIVIFLVVFVLILTFCGIIYIDTANIR